MTPEEIATRLNGEDYPSDDLEWSEWVADLLNLVYVYEDDMKAAAGELLVDLPRPGTSMAKLLSANVLMRHQRQRLEGLLAHATHFNFPDGTDCYERSHNGGTASYRNGDKEYHEGDLWWEARGCVEGESVQWVDTQREALEAIGHGPE